MLLTDDEAQTEVICPMMQRAGDQERTRCYGMGCAMWRWAEPWPIQHTRVCADRRATTEPERPARLPASWTFEPYEDEDMDDAWARWIEPEDEAVARRRGYCGLAGKPEEA